MLDRGHLRGFAGASVVAIALSVMTGLGAGPSQAHDPTSPATAAEGTPPPLWDNLGTLHYDITTASPQAQAYFDQGLRLAYAFNHGEAIRALASAM